MEILRLIEIGENGNITNDIMFSKLNYFTKINLKSVLALDDYYISLNLHRTKVLNECRNVLLNCKLQKHVTKPLCGVLMRK